MEDKRCLCGLQNISRLWSSTFAGCWISLCVVFLFLGTVSLLAHEQDAQAVLLVVNQRALISKLPEESMSGSLILGYAIFFGLYGRTWGERRMLLTLGSEGRV